MISGSAVSYALAQGQGVGKTVSAPPVVGYVAWYDASQISGQSDNSPLATWRDLSGNGYDLTQSTPVNRPTYYSTTTGKLVNNKPAVWFPTNVWLQTSSPILPQSVFLIGINSGNQDAYFGGVGSTTIELRDAGNVLQLLNSHVALIVGSVSAVPANVPAFIGCTLNATNSSLYINSATANATAGGASLTNDLFALGMCASGDLMINGAICELVAYPTVLTAPQITSIYNYLKTKWGTP